MINNFHIYHYILSEKETSYILFIDLNYKLRTNIAKYNDIFF